MGDLYRGIITKVVPYKENDAIVTLLVDNNSFVSFKARGVFKINSKNASSLQLYTIGEYTLESKTDYSNKTLSSASKIYFPLCIYDDLKYSIFLNFIVEIVNILKDENDDIYLLLEYAIRNIEELDINTYILMCFKYILKNNGVLFEVDECVSCGRKSIEVFNYNTGGFLCKKCMSTSKSNIDNLLYLKSIRIIMKSSLEKISLFKIDDAISYKIIIDLFKYIENNLGIFIKSKEMLLLSIYNTDSRLTR